MSNVPTSFNPQQFLDAQQTEVNEKRALLPVENPEDPNGHYLAVIGEVTTAAGTIEKGDRAGEPWVSMIVPLQIQVPQRLQEELRLRPTLTITDRVFLDLTPQGTIDNSPGRNRRQKDYRDALDLNKPGDVWSWRKAQGQVVKVSIRHEVYKDEPVDNINRIFPR